jgi:formate dehydrogenase subunit delta
MNLHHLATMANQIGAFFLSYPDREEAKAEIATHLQRFWAPRMRTQLLEHIAVTGGEGLDPLVLEAIEEHRARLLPLAA